MCLITRVLQGTTFCVVQLGMSNRSSLKNQLDIPTCSCTFLCLCLNNFACLFYKIQARSTLLITYTVEDNIPYVEDRTHS